MKFREMCNSKTLHLSFPRGSACAASSGLMLCDCKFINFFLRKYFLENHSARHRLGIPSKTNFVN